MSRELKITRGAGVVNNFVGVPQDEDTRPRVLYRRLRTEHEIASGVGPHEPVLLTFGVVDRTRRLTCESCAAPMETPERCAYCGSVYGRRP
jgi:hypothetical protein